MCLTQFVDKMMNLLFIWYNQCKIDEKLPPMAAAPFWLLAVQRARMEQLCNKVSTVIFTTIGSDG